MFFQIYDLLVNAFFGTAPLTDAMDIVVTLMSFIACLFVICLPFLIVYKIICLFVR